MEPVRKKEPRSPFGRMPVTTSSSSVSSERTGAKLPCRYGEGFGLRSPDTPGCERAPDRWALSTPMRSLDGMLQRAVGGTGQRVPVYILKYFKIYCCILLWPGFPLGSEMETEGGCGSGYGLRFQDQIPTTNVAEGVVSSLDFECTACNTKVPTTGSGCPTKSLESKFGFGKAKFGGKGVARRESSRRNSSSSGSAHHIPLHVTNRPPWALRSRLLGNEARSDHDSAAALQSKA